MYLVIDGVYYEYNDANGTYVVVPDPTQPVVTPPGPVTPSLPTYYSADGTRFVTVDPTSGDAYLYDATITDASDPQAQGIFLATGVSSAQFTYTTASDGTTQVLQQIDLSFTDGTTTAVADPNGQVLVTLPGDGTAVLTDLQDSSVDPVTLSQQAASVTMVDQDAQVSGEDEQVVQQIVVTQQDGTTAAFDPAGNAANDSLLSVRKPAPQPAQQVQTLQQRMQASPAFRALQNGFGW
jgi:hypothetical protein